MKGYKLLTEDQKQVIFDLNKKGLSVALIAEATGYSKLRVRYYLNTREVAANKPNTGNCFRHDTLLRKMVAENAKLDDIAKLIGSSRNRVKEYIVKNNIPWQKRYKTPELHSCWKGGRMVDKDGYVYLKRPAHPNCNRHGYIREHRLIMEQKLGRYLDRKEVVHHIDGNTQNNAIENLGLYGSNADHLAETLVGKVPNWTPEGFAKMKAKRPNKKASLRKPNREKSKPDVGR